MGLTRSEFTSASREHSRYNFRIRQPSDRKFFYKQQKKPFVILDVFLQIFFIQSDFNVPSIIPIEGQVGDDHPGRNIMQHRDGVDEYLCVSTETVETT